MSLLAPLALLFSITIPAVIVLYLLRVRLREFEVSSTYLWERLLRDLAAQDPWQKPRFTFLMLIQILVLGLLTVALARPAWQELVQGRVFKVLLIDSSASMQVADSGKSRFEEARLLAIDSLNRLPQGSSVALIAAKARPEVVLAATTDLGMARAAIARMQVSSTALDLSASLRLASAVAIGQTRAEIDLFTDGAFERPPDLPELAVRHHLVGGDGDNRAITAIAARAYVSDRERFQTYVRAGNFGAESATTTVALYADGAIVDRSTVTIPGQGSEDLIFDLLPKSATVVVEARVMEGDDLPVDNTAVTIIDAHTPIKMLLVSPGNIFLQRALTLLPNVELFRATPNRYVGISTDSYDMIVFDGYLPRQLPRQNLLVVNPPDSSLLTVKGRLNSPNISRWQSESPLLRYVSLDDVRIRSAALVEAPGWAQNIVEAEGHPLLLAGESGGRRVAIVAFDLQQSNLPLSAAFPILVANIADYLRPAAVLDTRAVASGSVITIRPAAQADEVDVTKPDGISVRQPSGLVLSYDQTDQVGLYSVRQKSNGTVISTEWFAVNLTDDEESNVRPRAPRDMAGQGDESDGEPVVTHREVWMWFVLGGLAMLTGEWWWYHRRA